MPTISISEAARRTGAERSTLYRKARRGELTLVREPDGTRSIELSELLRVYPDADREAAPPPGARHRGMYQGEQDGEIAVLRKEVELLRQQVEEMRRDKDDLRRRLDVEGEERRALARILTDQRAKEESHPTGWWQRLIGRG